MSGKHAKQKTVTYSRVDRVTMHKSGKHWVTKMVSQMGTYALKGAAVAGASLVLFGAAGTVQADEVDANTGDATNSQATDATLESAEVEDQASNAGTASVTGTQEDASSDTTASEESSQSDSSSATAPTVTARTTTAATGGQTEESSTVAASGNETTFSKTGTTITVSNPDVKVTGSNQLYGTTHVDYSVDFPDQLAINSGDSVLLTLPDALRLQTGYSFDVLNPDDAVVGHAVADPETKTILTTFNDYFESHPLHKNVSLHLDTKWDSEVVNRPGQEVVLNFNGSLVPVKVDGVAPPQSNEVIAKWGNQTQTDANVNSWWIRFNNARELLNYVTLTDTWGQGQTYVDGSMSVTFLKDWEGWQVSDTNSEQAQAFFNAFHVYAGGFEAKLDQLNDILVLNYQTRSTTGENPTNTIKFVAESTGGESTYTIERVTGNGRAAGDSETPIIPNTPTSETPNQPTPPNPTPGRGGSGFGPRPSATAMAAYTKSLQASPSPVAPVAKGLAVAAARLPETGSQDMTGLAILGFALMGGSLLLTFGPRRYQA
ncbi:Ig-like domain-containing protein [Streptococcus sp. DD12]|uniref:Ig-like domain-containing protein n=1 Tax=Streptococcus sp. DD12 TaxID=1777880 RepID=UPI00079B8D6A|nr:Ig-like domain-containing protein [Streptococcus sp. DD12]KXT76383.1 hypothetical protein STRDD12_00562 [Streptococcus sp. DD12]